MESESGIGMRIAEEHCTGCQRCQLTCSFINYEIFNPAQAFIKVIQTTDKEISFKVNRTEECLECGHCIDACAFGCLTGE